MHTQNGILGAIAAIAVGCVGLAFAGTAGAIDLRDWGRKFAASERFVVLGQFGKQAVLDKETQLVWQRTPASQSASNWSLAKANCLQTKLGGRLGWRLPSLHELNSLIEPAAAGQLALPPGHPFQTVPPGNYWTTTRQFNGTDAAAPFTMTVNVTGAGVVSAVGTSSASINSWCVRGESSASEH